MLVGTVELKISIVDKGLVGPRVSTPCTQRLLTKNLCVVGQYKVFYVKDLGVIMRFVKADGC